MSGYPIQPGEQFGQLTAQRMEHVMSRSGRVRAHWRCSCSCGGSILVDSGNLRTGNTKRCKACTDKAKGEAKTTHGYTRGGATPVYTVWQSMWSRCTIPSNKSYANYGGRGITVDPAWKSFEQFIADMGVPSDPDMQIERKDNDKGYSKENCVWATRKQQGRNKRNNIVLDYGGKKQTMIEWCEELGLKYDTVKRRLHQGWSTEEALQGGGLRRVEPSRTTIT